MVCKKYLFCLLHSSLKNNVFSAHVKFQCWIVHSERDIHVQRIKVQTIFFEYI